MRGRKMDEWVQTASRCDKLVMVTAVLFEDSFQTYTLSLDHRLSFILRTLFMYVWLGEKLGVLSADNIYKQITTTW